MLAILLEIKEAETISKLSSVDFDKLKASLVTIREQNKKNEVPFLLTSKYLLSRLLSLIKLFVTLLFVKLNAEFRISEFYVMMETCYLNKKFSV